jgi:hypothetical protein
MTIKQIGAATAISLAGVAALAIGAGTAAAASSGPSIAADTIVRWQADHNRVAVNEAGTVPIEDCTVSSDRPVQTRPAPTANPLTDVPVMQQTTTVHVALNC